MQATSDAAFDVIVVGGGNAGFTAAEAAASSGAHVALLEKESEESSGGNSFYTAGATRIVHAGLADLSDLVEPDDRHHRTVVPPYTRENYLADLDKVTDGRNDSELSEVLVGDVSNTIRWLHSLGLKYRLMYERQAYERSDGSFLFWGGLHVGNVGGGEGLIADHRIAGDKLGVNVFYGSPVTDLLEENGRIVGVRTTGSEGMSVLRAKSTVLAAGGFESDPEMRAQYLGAAWARAKVRGTPANTGEVLAAALRHGAARGGDWTTAHSVQWDAFARHNESNRELTNRLTRQSYPLGILVNRAGRRFLDEGADFRNYTYAKYGRAVLEQPDSVAWQLFDASTRPLLGVAEYDMPGISVETADTIEGLARKIGVNEIALSKTVSDFNASVDRSKTFDPTIKDGRGAAVNPPKSNWAVELSTPPYYAFAVTCGLTFTFGGIRADTAGRVLNENGNVVPGLYVCGEMLGGLFSGNYPGGSGLAAGIVFGRRAGLSAAHGAVAAEPSTDL